MAETRNASPTNAAPHGAWLAYRTWAATARYHKRILDVGASYSLRFGIAGAVLVALGQQLPLLSSDFRVLPLLSRGAATLGSAAIALSAYLSARTFSANHERTWVRCRAAAETIKSAIYLYRTSTPPFDTPARAEQLRVRIEQSLTDLRDVDPRTPEATEPAPALASLSVEEYRVERTQDQIKWYRKRAAEFQAQSDRFIKIIWVLGALSALLGLASAVNWISPWVAVIATISASITAYLKNQRYQFLIGVYQATATRIQLLDDEWADSGKGEADKLARDQFIQRCEDTLALENSSWVAQLTSPAAQPQSPQSSASSADPQPDQASTPLAP